MSFRELRNFCEVMRSLGYPRLISMENFRTPNFELVADILHWLTRKYDNEAGISDRIESVDDRVTFLTQIVQLFATKARLKLNPKRLYAADGNAVREMLKIAQMLNRAMKLHDSPNAGPVTSPAINAQDVKEARVLASQITEKGVTLFDLLAAEPESRKARTQALRFLDVIANAPMGSKEHTMLERSLQRLVEEAQENRARLAKQVEDLESDATTLNNKIKKKEGELTHLEKRVRSLADVRPAFMDEYERLEVELSRLYEYYVQKYRNLDYLEHELEQYSKAEQERKQEADRRLQKMREKLLKEEVEILRGNREDIEDSFGAQPFHRTNSGDNGVFGKFAQSRNANGRTRALSEEDDSSNESKAGSDVEESDDDQRTLHSSVGSGSDDLLDGDDDDEEEDEDDDEEEEDEEEDDDDDIGSEDGQDNYGIQSDEDDVF